MPLGQLLPLRRDILGFLTKLARQYGDVVSFRLGPIKACLLNHPDYIRDVLVVHDRRFAKGRPLELAKRLLGEGLLTSEGEHHRRHRQLIQPLFHRKRLPAYAGAMVEAASRLTQRWQEGEVRDISLDMADLALAISGKTMFDANIEEEAHELGQALRSTMELFSRVSIPLSELLLKIPLPSTRRFYRSKARLDETIHRLIDERRTEGTDHGDLLSLLLGMHEPAAAVLSDEEVRDEALIFLLAAFDTTALALTWTWYLMSQHADVEARLHEELDSVLRGRLPSAADLDHLRYVQQVFSEVLRLYPPGYLVARKALAPYEVAGYVLPAGTLVLMSPYLIQRDSRFYRDPDSFDPDRWEAQDPHATQQFAFFPFGGGPRRCIGDAFAWMEATLVIATVAQRWRPRLLPGFRVELQPLLNLRPKHGVKMTLEPRAAALCV